ncbi:hypothetical protein TrRE_jg3594 [Triparma retinervis]|nr:hypothetical protein TrRE_jg3594 [Triparma retinervis]
MKRSMKMLKVGSSSRLRSGSDAGDAYFERVSAYSAYEKVGFPMLINAIKAEACQYPGSSMAFGEVSREFMSRTLAGFNWGEKWGWKLFGDVLQLFLLDASEVEERAAVSSPAGTRPLGSRDCDIFVYDYGCVVFWGLDSANEHNFIDALKPFSEGKRSPSDMKESSDTMYFAYEDILESSDSGSLERFEGCMSDSENFLRVKNDRIVLHEKDRVLKLSLSFAMAQSCNLFIFESLVTTLIEETKSYPSKLHTHGTFGLSRLATRKLMGRVYEDRCKVTLYSDLLEVPTFFWDDDIYEPVYQVLKSYLDLAPRMSVLNTRLTVLDDLLMMLNSLSESSHSSHLEWIIIWLIMAELLFQVGWNICVKDLDLFGLRDEYGWGDAD